MPRTISARLLRRLLSYDPSTGELVWRKRPAWMFPCHNEDGKRSTHAQCWNKRYAGKPALNCVDSRGYKAGSIFKRRFRAHRVIWAISTGAWPAEDIDHVSGDRLDNRLGNLRAVPRSENNRNASLSRSNKSGTPGVYWDKALGQWRAYIRVNRTFLHLGVFEADELDRAISARKEAEFKFGFHPNHGRAAQ